MRTGAVTLLVTASLLAAGNALPQANDDLADETEDIPPEVTRTLDGHLKVQFNMQTYPTHSLFQDIVGSSALDNSLEARARYAAIGNQWDFKADYQFITLYADSLRLAQNLPGTAYPLTSVISDDRRWWNLTYGFGDSDKTAIIHRLDRLNVGFTTERTAWRFGRQAISWGNGMVFSPMDIFNPFDPAAVDKEYKTGDDMLYGQILFDNGSDLQAVAVVRRDPVNGDVESDQSSLAFKYHGFLGGNEFDLLAAEHYGDQVLGLGGVITLGGAIWRSDLTWTDTELESVYSLATSLSYSWVWGGKNISGLLEYYYGGFGQKDGEYTLAELARNPELTRRIERGELFTLARNYLAASAAIEMTPLIVVTPNLYINLDDPSALAQLVTSYNWKQDIQLVAALNIPIGPNGSEYGGIEAPVEGFYFSTGPSIFAQFAWYF
jgi:hypothetical protein